MDTFIQQIINGLVLGSVYALVALGYTMVYGIINLINFAHGEVLMVGALTSWTVVTVFANAGLPGWLLLLLSLIAAILVCTVLNFAIEKIAYRPLRNAPRLAPLITAPRIWNGSLGSSSGNDLKSGFQMIIASVCSSRLMPIAVINGASRGALRSGR